MQEAKQKKGASTLDKINFVLMGISSLIGWSAVCNSFGYFIDKFSKVNGNIPFVFPIPQMFANFFFGLLMPFLVKYSDKTRIVISLFGLGVALTLLPVIGMI
jgi:equilibrative nucleoside transporter 1/2/3